jgi:hypothetical protein
MNNTLRNNMNNYKVNDASKKIKKIEKKKFELLND